MVWLYIVMGFVRGGFHCYCPRLRGIIGVVVGVEEAHVDGGGLLTFDVIGLS